MGKSKAKSKKEKKSRRSEKVEDAEKKTKNDKRALKLVLEEAERFRKSPEEKEKTRPRKRKEPKPEPEEEEESSEPETVEEDDATHSDSQEEDSSDLFESEEEVEGRCADGMYTALEWVPHMEPNKHISSICLASRNSGKSYLMKSMIKNSLRGFFDLYIVICDTADTRKEYKEAIEGEPGVVVECFDHLPEGLWDNIKADHDAHVEAGTKPLSICIILDDASAMGVGQDQQLLSLYCNARHCATSIFWSLHHPRVVSTIIRSNSDLIIILKIKAPQMRDSVIKNLLMGSIDFPQLGLPPPKSEKKFFESVLSTYCKNQGDTLVLDQRPRNQRGNDTEEELFQYRAPAEKKHKPVKEDDRSRE